MNTVKLHGLTLIWKLWSARGSLAEVYMEGVCQGKKRECGDCREVFMYIYIKGF